MKVKILIATMIALSFTELASACQFDSDCTYPAQCARYHNSVDGVCVGGYAPPKYDGRNNQPADIYGSSGNLIMGIINLFRGHRKPKVEPKEEESHE